MKCWTVDMTPNPVLMDRVRNVRPDESVHSFGFNGCIGVVLVNAKRVLLAHCSTSYGAKLIASSKQPDDVLVIFAPGDRKKIDGEWREVIQDASLDMPGAVILLYSEWLVSGMSHPYIAYKNGAIHHPGGVKEVN